MYDREWLRDVLVNGVCVVTFNKVDGTERVMRCTLQQKYLPESQKGHGGLLVETDRNTLSVWDIEANAWRSFRIESIVTVKLETYDRPSQEMLLG